MAAVGMGAYEVRILASAWIPGRAASPAIVATMSHMENTFTGMKVAWDLFIFLPAAIISRTRLIDDFYLAGEKKSFLGPPKC